MTTNDQKQPRFDHTYCSRCFEEFGEGDGGYSDCDEHADREAVRHDGDASDAFSIDLLIDP
jgi:hypothetical protein